MDMQGEDEKIIEILKSGGVGVLPTDTIYGIVGSALSKKAVKRLYRVRKRNMKKPMIVLVGSVRDIAFFGISLEAPIKKKLANFWPGKVSVILPCLSKKFSYLHRGTNSLAFRLPKKKELVALIKKTGPLVAPSANIEGKPPARTVREARKYFGDKADFYVDVGRISSKPSRVVIFEKHNTRVLR